ncbi:MAG: hypothetical protein DCC57_05300 [Chloroflexi bacterium]|nr:MAG: hypothetical protein DCC57_05300 [Chloroflexota bacterium]
MGETQRARVGLGCHVEVELIDDQGQAERMAFDLVPAHAADFDRGLLAETTPLAKAIRGKPAGAVVPYVQGDIRRVRIVAVRAGEMEAAPDAAARRQAVLDEARRKAEQTNAEMFAASFSGKWGDYQIDPDPDDDSTAAGRAE